MSRLNYSLVGMTFGELTVIAKVDGKDYAGRTLWQCKCTCGKFKEFYTTQLTQKTRPTKTCGKCENHIHHKEAYISWSAARQRCDDSNHKDYPKYGGRGIKMCLRWNKFVTFLADMGDPPVDDNFERLTLERLDNNGHYEPNNCVWATRSEQQHNKAKHGRLQLK